MSSKPLTKVTLLCSPCMTSAQHSTQSTIQSSLAGYLILLASRTGLFFGSNLFLLIGLCPWSLVQTALLGSLSPMVFLKALFLLLFYLFCIPRTLEVFSNCLGSLPINLPTIPRPFYMAQHLLLFNGRAVVRGFLCHRRMALL